MSSQPQPPSSPRTLARLRVQIVRAQNLVARDKNGKSDPYVVLSIPGILSKKRRTVTKKKTLDPVWSPAEGTYDLDIDPSWLGQPVPSSSHSPRRTFRPLHKAVSHLRIRTKTPVPSGTGTPDSAPPSGDESNPLTDSSADEPASPVHALEFVLWDEDRFSSADYLGECSLSVDQWATPLDAAGKHTSIAWSDAEPIVLPLGSMRKFQGVTGDLIVKVGFLSATDPVPEPGTVGAPLSDVQAAELDTLYRRLLSHQNDVGAVWGVPADRTIGMTNDAYTLGYDDYPEPEGPGEDETDDDASLSDTDSFHTAHYRSIAGVPDNATQPPAGLPAVPPAVPPADDSSSPRPESPRPRLIRRIRHKSRASSPSPRAALDSGTESTGSGRRHKRRSLRPPRRRNRARQALVDAQRHGSINALGVALIEIQSASNLPRWSNMAKTGFDMDPFTIVSFSRRVFRTAVVRHNLNPVWNQKMMLPVEEFERNFVLKFNVFDWDRLTTHDEIGSSTVCISDLIAERQAQLEAEGGGRDPVTGLYPLSILQRESDISFGAQVKVLDLHRKAGGETQSDETMPVVTEKGKPCTLTITTHWQPYALLRQRLWYRLLRHYDENENHATSLLELETMLESLNSSVSSETMRSWFSALGKDPDEEDELTFEEAIAALERATLEPHKQRPTLHESSTSPTLPSDTRPMTLESKKANATAPLFNVGPLSSSDADHSSSSGLAGGEAPVERLLNLTLCPLCSQQDMTGWTEFGQVTHLALCGSRDWSQVDNFTVRSYVTESQAQRKWYTKLVRHVAQGSYALGANNANLIVTDRATGKYLEEHMAIYVRLGIRLMYQAGRSRMEGRRVQKLLRSLTLKQGRKYDDPASVKDIAPFVKFHQLNLDEILLPLEKYRTFNQFFYRKLKPGARPLEDPDNSLRVVSAADCRMMCFPSVSEATRIWIKGHDFSARTLLGEAAPEEELMRRLEQGSLCIFRLAPQDYHRFHMPVTGTIEAVQTVGTAYYTVNPMAIRSSSIDVYGQNHRVVVRLSSPESDGFGTFYMVCVGAMMVGTTVLTRSVGDTVERGDELGYFAFGGSTVVTLFQPGTVQFDHDLLANSAKAVETIVKVGNGIASPPPE